MYRTISVVALLVALILGVSLVTGRNPFSASPVPAVHAAREARPAPDFTLVNLEGKPVSLSAYRGKVVVLNFWASWCPPCRAEIPSMEKLYATLKDEDFALLAVNVEGGGRPAVAAFAKRMAMRFPVLLDADQQVAGLYGVGGIPQTFIINKRGEIVQAVTGGRDWNAPATVKMLRSLIHGE